MRLEGAWISEEISMKRGVYIGGLLLAILLLLGGSALHTVAGYSDKDLSGHAWGSDDAYISYRYARNLVEGHGLVYNAGERVEGYSNFLYTLLIALGMLAIPDHRIYYFSVVVNAIFMSAALIVFSLAMRRRHGNATGLVAAFLFALFPALWSWVASGLETPLIVLLQIIIWLSAERLVAEDGSRSLSRGVLCAAMVLSILARADGFIAPGLAIGYLLLKRRWKDALFGAAVVVVTVGVYFGWRMAYYGYLLPNTYYAKVAGPLFTRFKLALKQLILESPYNGMLPYFVIVLLAADKLILDFLRERRQAIQKVGFELVFAAGLMATWFYIGGDRFRERFLVVIFALGLSLFFKLNLSGVARWQIMGVVVPVLLMFHVLPFARDPRFDYMLDKYDRWVLLGEYLGEHHSGQVLAIDAAGKVPFYSRLETIDMLGLNDETIGHMPVEEFLAAGHTKFDPEYVFSRSPDLIAAWLNPDLNMDWGLDRARYEVEGYRLRYVVNGEKVAQEDNIIDVSDMGPEQIIALVNQGYDYGVLERQP